MPLKETLMLRKIVLEYVSALGVAHKIRTNRDVS